MKTVIVEDSPLAVAELKELLREHQDIEVVAHAGNVDHAVSTIKSEKPDLVFLDINMPGGDGFDVLEQLDYSPQVIFTTAYDEYAIKSFEYNTLDYLLKPINPKRLKRAIEKLEPNLNETECEQTLALDHKLFVRFEEQCWLVKLNDIQWFESSGNQCWLYFDEHKAPLNKSLNKIEPRLPLSDFIKINRQQIVNLNFIADMELAANSGLKLILKNGKELMASRRAATQLKQMMSI